MCIAIVKPASSPLDDKTLVQCFENNPDGAGFAIATVAGVQIHKGFMDVHTFLEAYRKHDVNAHNALIHFRITTRGTDGPENSHPFALACGALVHNGTISGLGEVGKGKSDTQIFADMLGQEDFATLQRLAPVLEGYVDGWNKVAIMGHDGQVLVLNAAKWIEHNGVLFSNDGFKEGGGYGFSWSRSRWDDDYAPAATHTESVIDAYDEWGFFWDEENRLWVLNEKGIYERNPFIEKAALDDWMNYQGADEDELYYITYDLIQEENEQWNSTNTMPANTAPSTDSLSNWLELA